MVVEQELDNLEKRIEYLESKIVDMAYGNVVNTSPVVLNYKKLVPEAKLYKKRESDSCWDVFCTSVQQEAAYIEYGTGLAFSIPEGYEIKAYARSSVSVTPLILCNGVGVVDEEYRGELLLRFKAIPGYKTRRYDVGDRIGQIQLVKKVKAVAREIDELDKTSRGSGGFGSTGK